MKGKNATMTDADGLSDTGFHPKRNPAVNSPAGATIRMTPSRDSPHEIQHMSNYFYCEPAAKVAEKPIKPPVRKGLSATRRGG